MKIKPLYIIADFSCGRFYTHHSSYLKDYEEFLLSEDCKVEVWVNNSADYQIFSMFSSPVKPILHSTLYSHTSKTHFLQFLINSFISKSFNSKFINKYLGFLTEKAKNILSYFYLQSAVKQIKKYSKQGTCIQLIFPTADALSIRLTNLLLNNKKMKIEMICARIVGAEKRGAFSIPNGIDYMGNLIEKYGNRLRVGYEVKGIEELFRGLSIKENNIFWAPMPHIWREQAGSEISLKFANNLKIGFLGSARRNKGFDEIPNIINELRDMNINFHAFIQKPNFPWAQSKLTIKYLDEFHSKNVTYIQSASDKKIIDYYVSQMDILILPYSFEDYRLAGSGLLYIACDYKVPVATYPNLGFSWDVEYFKQGILFKNYNDLSELLIGFSKDNFSSQIDNYNNERFAANYKFIF